MIAAALMYGVLAAVFTWPLMLHFQTSIIGGTDAFQALWGLWWFERALLRPDSLWNCPLVLHPYGADLVQHDWQLWPNVFALAARRLGLTLVGSYNAAILMAIWLNALSVFLLARAVVKEWLPAFVAGLLYGSAAYFGGRIQGHFWFMHAYPLPLLALCLQKIWDTRCRRWALGVGGSLVLAVWSEHYYAVYAGVYALLFFLYHSVSLEIRQEARPSVRRGWQIFFVTLGALAGTLGAVVAQTGGWRFFLWGVRISIRRPGRALTVCLASWFAAFLLRNRLRVLLGTKQGPFLDKRHVRLYGYMALPLVLLVPIMVRAGRLLLRGDFGSQWASVASGLMGVHALSIVFPNIYHPLWGEWLRGALSTWELWERGTVGLGWAAISVVLLTRVYRAAGWWRFAFVGFLVLSLGPFLEIFPGWRISPPLPFWVLRYIPIVEGARVPSRWVAMALVPWAMLVALGVQGVTSSRWRVAVLAAVLFEGLAAPWQVNPVSVPSMYRAISRDTRAGALLELPFGVMDGRRMWGAGFPPELLYYQTVHGKRLVGGYISRIPDRIFDEYRDQPVLWKLATLQEEPEEGEGIDRGEFLRFAAEWEVTWIVLDRYRASPSLERAVLWLLGPPLLEEGHLMAWSIS